ncbi:MAG: hypothetical protein IJ092_14755, partial [Atopobiaceae bacterium]|nr:hypothetical protein [Atopobiaceae bacterium]
QAKQAIDLVERAIRESQEQRLRQDEEMVERAQRDAMRLRSYSKTRAERQREHMSSSNPYAFDPQGPDATMRPPAMPKPRKNQESSQAKQKTQEPELTILEQKPREPPPVLPLEEAVEQVRAKLFPKGKK